MKQSIFTKNLEVKGSVKTVTGKIIVTMNHSQTMLTGTNNFTHDNYSKAVPTHKIEGFMGDICMHTLTKLTEESEVFKAVERIEKSLLESMQYAADNPTIKSFSEEMAQLGFVNQ